MQIFGLSDQGKKRETNEDSFGIVGFFDESSCGCCMVADGMGGHKAGEVASRETVDLITSELSPYIGKDMTEQNIKVLMVSAIKNANTKIRKMAEEASGRAGMGTTVVAAFSTNDTVYIANVGDSRAYVINDVGITQITNDHSLVEELIADGTITRDEAKVHPRKHVITRAIGADNDILADVFEYKYRKGRHGLPNGDILLLCSDGLTEMLNDDEIRDIANANDDIKVVIETLVNKANEYGGVDNITVIGIRF